MGRKDRRLLVSVSALLLAGGSLFSVSAHAVDSPPPPAPAAPGSAAPAFTVKVPSVEAVGSSVDTDTLKAIFTGDLTHAADLAKLNATSIHVPEIDISFSSPEAGAPTFSYVYKDIDIRSVSNGVAQSATVGTAEATSGTTDFKFGKMSVGLLDIGGLLAFYGVVPGSSAGVPQTMYKNFDFSGGSFSGPGFSCDIGEVTAAEFKARPLKVPFGELMTLIGSPEFQKKEPSPAAIGKLVGFYADFFTAFETSPVELKSLDCSSKDDKGGPVKITMGPLSIGGFASGRYPAIEAKNLDIIAADGSMSLGSVTMKSFDLSAPLKVLQDASGSLTEAWFTANARKLIPAFEGFGFSDFKMDIPDSDNPGQRIKAAIGDFDLGLSDYFAGIPTTIKTSSHHLVLDVPPATEGKDDSLAELRQLGIEKVDLGFDLAVHRDAAARTIILDKLAVNGAQLGSIAISGTLGNVDEVLFTGDKDSAMLAAMALTVKSLKLDVVDQGLADIVLKRTGAEQGMDLATARSTMSGVAQGVVLVGLGGTPEAKVLGDAIGKFIAGGTSLTVTADAKDPAGLSMADFAAAQNDPKALSSKITVDATAK